jgi:hypothetical protein
MSRQPENLLEPHGSPSASPPSRLRAQEPVLPTIPEDEAKVESKAKEEGGRNRHECCPTTAAHECPELIADDVEEFEKAEPAETEPRHATDAANATSLVSIPMGIIEQLPGYYWHGMEEDLADEGLAISLPWSILEPRVFSLD